MPPNRINLRGGPALKRRARSLRAAMTDAERLLWRELRRYELGWRFRRQVPIPPYIVDFACLEARLIVEADGSQHARPSDHDRRDAFLRRQGWRVLRFWNNDIISNRLGVRLRIAEALEGQSGPDPLPNPPPLAGEGDDPSRPLKAREADNASPPPQAGEG